MGTMRNADFYSEKLKGRALWRSSHRWENNIKTDLKAMKVWAQLNLTQEKSQ
jgi:hypothetical protein